MTETVSAWVCPICGESVDIVCEPYDGYNRLEVIARCPHVGPHNEYPVEIKATPITEQDPPQPRP